MGVKSTALDTRSGRCCISKPEKWCLKDTIPVRMRITFFEKTAAVCTFEFSIV